MDTATQLPPHLLLQLLTQRVRAVSSSSTPTGPTVLVRSAVGTSAAAATSVTATLPAPATAGDIIWAAFAGDKNSGAITPPAGTWNVLYTLGSTSVTIWVGWMVAAGGETALTVSHGTASAAGDTLWLGEYASTSPGSWQIFASASHGTDETSVTSWSSGTTGASTAAGYGIAFFAIDSGQSATGPPDYSNGFQLQRQWAVSGRGDMAVAVLPGIPSGTVVETTSTHTLTADQISAAVAVFGRATAGGSVTIDAAPTFTATITAAADSTKPVDAAATITATITATAASTKPVDAALTVTAALTASASVTSGGVSIDAAPTFTATITPAAVTTKPAAAALTATATLTAAAASAKPVDATLTATATATAAAASTKPVTAAPTYTATITTAATSTKPVAAGLTVTAALTADATIGTAPVTIAGAPTFTATITPAAASLKPVTAALTNTATITAAAASTKPVQAALTATATITASAANAAAYTPALVGLDGSATASTTDGNAAAVGNTGGQTGTTGQDGTLTTAGGLSGGTTATGQLG